jgi:Ser/Thr protein kinase RdoA (MazF antagonist)
LKNDDICTYRGRIFHLQKFINGITCERLTESQLMKSAEMLATIHSALEDATFLKPSFREGWFDEWTPMDSIERHQAIIDELPNTQKSLYYQEQAANVCRAKINLLRAYDGDPKIFKNLKCVNTHGDYNNFQLLWNRTGREICAVIDFSNAAKLPAVWEIVRSYTLGAKECERGDKIDPEGLWKYVRKYMEKAELSFFDIQNMLR